MKFRTHAAAMIYIGSYLPLSVILLTQDYQYEALSLPWCSDWLAFTSQCHIPLRNPLMALSLFAVCLMCFLFTLLTLTCVKPRLEVAIEEARHIPSDLMNYVLPYVVSFMSLDYQETSKFIGFIIFLAWLFWITHKSGQIILNPLLIVFGWKLYEIRYRFAQSPNVLSGVCLSKVDLFPNQTHKQRALEDVLIIKE
ncbi:hypothetical protein NAU58_07380 [Pseudomonas stutzeri]|nr:MULTISPECIES: hypothetical protein [Pseudomonadaceae]MBG4244487.1 hypothetical protein [Pseudomonas aeruginosa]MCQ4295393.1 hypothetical protein [Stutzerimonas stutzeri]